MGKPGGIDYDLVEKNACSILRAKSKDLRVLAFLSLVYLRREHWEAFADVFDALAKLCAQDFESLFPERPRAKQLAFKWLSEAKFVDALAEKQPATDDHEHIGRLVEALEAMRPVLEQQFPDGPPFPSALYKAAQDWRKKSAPRPAAPAPAAAPSATPAAAPAQAQSLPMETPSQAQAAVRKAALMLVEKEPTKPMGYRLLRAARWDLLEKAPPAQEGTTQLEGPNEQQRTAFAGLAVQGDWATLLQKCETAFAGRANHLWLDLQRYTAAACKGLGASYGGVLNAVQTETALLCGRIPELPTLRFSDGSGFCDETTREWLATDVATILGSGGGSTQGAGAERESTAVSPLEKERREASTLAAAGRVQDAITLIREGMRNSSSEQDNFRRSLLTGSLLLKGKQPQVAVSVLEALSEKIERYHLDRWDPDLAVDVLVELHAAYRAARGGAAQPVQVALTEKQTELLGRISRIDPTRACGIKG